MAIDFLKELSHCRLCPRRCGADRRKTAGLCGVGDQIRLSRAVPHFWEEPCISGSRGSGAIFFSGCSLGCSFCQNLAIRDGKVGVDISAQKFEQICFALKSQGVHNLNLVTADHQIPLFLPILQEIKDRLGLPIVYNCGGYESLEMLSALKGTVDVYLPDLKFFSPDLSKRWASAPDYFQVASAAIEEMVAQTGSPVWDEEGMLISGTMVRHLVLPGCRTDSLQVIDWLGNHFKPSQILISLMSQYTPNGSQGTPNRRLTTFEYQCVAKKCEQYGFDGYFQERSSAKEEYTPPFDLQGLE
jgi:putative pyruvate formate lyase activating enzyme